MINNIVLYNGIALFCIFVIVVWLWTNFRKNKILQQQIEKRFGTCEIKNSLFGQSLNFMHHDIYISLKYSEGNTKGVPPNLIIRANLRTARDFHFRIHRLFKIKDIFKAKSEATAFDREFTVETNNEELVHNIIAEIQDKLLSNIDNEPQIWFNKDGLCIIYYLPKKGQIEKVLDRAIDFTLMLCDKIKAI